MASKVPAVSKGASAGSLRNSRYVRSTLALHTTGTPLPQRFTCCRSPRRLRRCVRSRLARRRQGGTHRYDGSAVGRRACTTGTWATYVRTVNSAHTPFSRGRGVVFSAVRGLECAVLILGPSSCTRSTFDSASPTLLRRFFVNGWPKPPAQRCQAGTKAQRIGKRAWISLNSFRTFRPAATADGVNCPVMVKAVPPDRWSLTVGGSSKPK